MYGAHTAAHAEDTITEALALLSDSLKGASVPAKMSSLQFLWLYPAPTIRASASSEVGDRTVRALTTPFGNIGGVVFLSDAQNPEEGMQT